MGIAERWSRFRELPPDIELALERLIPLFEKEGVMVAYLFGSLSKGRMGNDVDLAILVKDAPAFRLRDVIAECLGTERVDLVDLQCASPVLRFEILRTGRLLYVADEEVQERFELATLRLYRDTMPLRRRQKDYLRRRMVGATILRPETVEKRLKELDEILGELGKYRNLTWEDFQGSLTQRWIIERGLIAAPSVIFHIADHILTGHFGLYPETYEESLERLAEKGVLSDTLYSQLKGLGSFRNILIHRYLEIDPREVFENFRKGLDVFPGFAREILIWLDTL